MKKIIFLYIGLILVVAVLILFKLGNLSFLTNTSSPYVQVDNKGFNVSVAKTEEQKITGLSNTNKLDQEAGMLFVFKEKDYYPFWMKNMKFPIDMIFISDNKVVDVYKNVTPPKGAEQNLPIYKPKEKANYVLEVNAGLADKYDIKPGDQVALKNVSL